MTKPADFWKAHLTAEGKIAWPEQQADRDALARQLVGLCFVEALDYWLAHADELIDNPNPPTEPWQRASEPPALRSTFAGMTDDQRSAVRTLLRDTVAGTLFTALVRIDQNPPEPFEIRLPSGGQSGLAHPQPKDDLHDALYDWVEQFSVYRDLLMVRNQSGVRWRASGDQLIAGPRP